MAHAEHTHTAGRRWTFTQIFLVAGLPAVWAGAILLSIARPRLFLNLTREDGVIELLQVLVLVATALVTAAIAWRLHRNNEKRWSLLYAGVTFGLICIAGEEISWGQRLLGMETSGFFARYNKQGETNLHNLKLVMPLSPHLSTLMLLVLTTLSLRSRRMSGATFASRRAYLWVPPLVLLPAWLCYLSYRAVRTARSLADIRSNLVLSRLEEPGELIFYIGLFAFALIVLKRLRDSGRRSVGT